MITPPLSIILYLSTKLIFSDVLHYKFTIFIYSIIISIFNINILYYVFLCTMQIINILGNTYFYLILYYNKIYCTIDCFQSS